MIAIAVTAKFRVSRKTPMGGYTTNEGTEVSPYATEVELTPDYADGKNKEWAAATPSGVIRLTIANEAALVQFNVNDAFTILFNKED